MSDLTNLCHEIGQDMLSIEAKIKRITVGHIRQYKIDTIKMIRRMHSTGLKESKDVVEIIANSTLPPETPVPHGAYIIIHEADIRAMIREIQYTEKQSEHEFYIAIIECLVSE